MAVTAQAQNQAPATGAQSNLGIAGVAPRIQVNRYYTELRRATTEDIVVVLILQKDFVDFLTTPASPVPGILPVALELQPAEGLRPSKLRYPKAHKKKFAFAADQIPVYGAVWFPIQLRLKAEQDAPLGQQVLVGKLTYQTVNDGGVSALQQVEVQIPITVVNHRSHASRDKDWPFTRISGGQMALIIVLAIVLSPVLVPLCTVAFNGCG
ncbi:MAG: hypothetical protein LAN83_07885 [Acidobacteriia bacterium]|nr:hypothetical protein [Terriglobia bacterium]